MKMLRLLFVVLLTFTFAFASAQVKLEYSFKIGDQYKWIQNTKQTVKQSIMGMEQNMETAYDGVIKLKVAELTSTGAKIETTFIKLKNTAKSPMGDVVMDSEGAEDNTQNKVFKAMMNKPFYIFMDKKGVIEKVEGVENLWSGFKEAGLDEATAATMKQSMEQLLGKDALKGSFEQAFVTYPENKVKPGDTWNAKAGAPLNFPLQVENKWSLTSLENTVAKLVADGTFTTTDKEKVVNLPGGLKAKVDLNGQQAMKANVDTKSGWPSTLEVLSELKGTMTLLAGGVIPEDMEIPMEILTETSFKTERE